MTSKSSGCGATRMRRITKEDWLAGCAEREANGTAEPAQYGATVYADPKIQATLAMAAKIQPVLTKMQPALAATQKAREAAHKVGAFKQMREVARIRRNASAPRKISRGHSARPATNKRTRGSRRVAAATASSGGGDPPDESDSKPPGKSSTARRCSECNEDISDLRADATVCRKAACRRRKSRREAAARERSRERIAAEREKPYPGIKLARRPRLPFGESVQLYLTARRRLEAIGARVDPGLTPEVFEARPEAREVAAAMDPTWCRSCFALYLDFGRGEQCFDHDQAPQPIEDDAPRYLAEDDLPATFEGRRVA